MELQHKCQDRSRRCSQQGPEHTEARPRTKFRFLQRNRKEVKRYFYKPRDEMQLTSRGSSLDTSCTSVQVQKRLGTLKKYPDDPEEKWDELAKQVTDVYLVQKHPILKGCINFQQGELKKGGAKMQFHADDSSVK